MHRIALPLLAVTLIAAAPPPISAARIKADVATLASDDFGGRGPGVQRRFEKLETLGDLGKFF